MTTKTATKTKPKKKKKRHTIAIHKEKRKPPKPWAGFNGRIGGKKKRKRTTIRVDPVLWAAFLKDLAKKHLRSCNVLEALVSMWLYGGSNVPGLSQPMTVNLTWQRVMERAAKKPHVEAVDNHYTRARGWFFDADLEAGTIIIEQPKSAGLEDRGFVWDAEHQYYIKKASKSTLKRDGSSLKRGC